MGLWLTTYYKLYQGTIGPKRIFKELEWAWVFAQSVAHKVLPGLLKYNCVYVSIGKAPCDLLLKLNQHRQRVSSKQH